MITCAIPFDAISNSFIERIIIITIQINMHKFMRLGMLTLAFNCWDFDVNYAFYCTHITIMITFNHSVSKRMQLRMSKRELFIITQIATFQSTKYTDTNNGTASKCLRLHRFLVLQKNSVYLAWLTTKKKQKKKMIHIDLHEQISIQLLR